MSSSPIEARTALKQTEIGPEPSDWETIEVGRVCRIENGCPFESAFFNAKEGLPLIRIRDVHSGQSETLYSGPYEEKYVVNDGDLLVGMDGEFRVRKWRAGKGLLNQRVCRLVPDEQQIDKDFVYFSVGIPLKKIEDFTPYTTVKHISATQIRAIVLPHPPLTEQRKIAAVLGMVQRAIEKQERLIALTTELKKALLHQLFTQGLRGEPQKQTEIGPVPESWEVVELGSLAKVGNGSTPKRDNEGYWQGGMIPWLNSAKIHERFITEADQFVTDLAVKECHLPRVKPGSLLVAITGQGKTLGNTALVSFETCINQHLAYAQFTTSRVVPEFVLWFMQTRYDHLRSISQAGGSTKGALTCGYLKTYPVPVPALDEQHEIAAVFAALDRKEKVPQRKHAAFTALFRTLLHQLMTAQLRVHDLELCTDNLTGNPVLLTQNLT